MLVYFGIALLASIIGSASGIGGGVIIKPVLDAAGGLGAAQINFMSACTVLAMSASALVRRRGSVRACMNTRLLWLAAGSALGGTAGKILFDALRRGWAPGLLRAAQSAALALMCLLVLVYMLRRPYVRARQLGHKGAIALMGLALGAASAFLGIGGGPFNLIALSLLFSMGGKDAALCSIFMILCSQTTSLCYTLIQGAPEVEVPALALMVAGGILGGALGSGAAKGLTHRQTDLVFSGVVALILLLSGYNALTALA